MEEKEGDTSGKENGDKWKLMEKSSSSHILSEFDDVPQRSNKSKTVKSFLVMGSSGKYDKLEKPEQEKISLVIEEMMTNELNQAQRFYGRKKYSEAISAFHFCLKLAEKIGQKKVVGFCEETIEQINSILLMSAVDDKKKGEKKKSGSDDLEEKEVSSGGKDSDSTLRRSNSMVTESLLEYFTSGRGKGSLMSLVLKKKMYSKQKDDDLRKRTLTKVHGEKQNTPTFKFNPKHVVIKHNRLLGEGSVGKVYEGIIRVGVGMTKCAVKKIPLKIVNRQLIEKEIMTMSKCQHENILSIFGCYFDDKYGYVVMELAGQCLFDFLQKQRKNPSAIMQGLMGVKTKLKFIYQIARAMSYLHRSKLIHRDLKTQNVMLTADRTCKICDFGTTKRKKSVNNTFCGTSEYLSSEQYDLSLLAELELIDVYSFGICIHEIWTLRIPFENLKRKLKNNDYELLAHIHEKVLRPDINQMVGAPEELKELAVSCWSHLPEHRPDSFDLIVDSLKGIIKKSLSPKKVGQEVSLKKDTTGKKDTSPKKDS